MPNQKLPEGYEKLSPDIVESTLPFLSEGDIRHLSHTNKYFHKLLNFDSSETLWHELYNKTFGTPYGNNEPFVAKGSSEFKTCSEFIMLQRYPEKSWQDRYKIRAEEAKFYTWGCLRHARLGYTATSNENLTDARINNLWGRYKSGVNTPTAVPWYPEDQKHSDDDAIIQISSGGFSFQILTKSGKLFSTGSTSTGGHKGPGPTIGQHDYDPLRAAVRELEESFHQAHQGVRAQISTTGTIGISPPSLSPHQNLYEPLERMEALASETIPGNEHIRRMFARNCFELFISENPSFTINQEKINAIKFIAVVSGRSHFLAMDEEHDLYSWDTLDSEFGVKLSFDGLPSKNTNPIIKIGCGWDLSCAFIYKIGLVVWNSRRALKRGQLTSAVDYKIIPNTADVNGPGKVVDFACFQGDCVIYITNEGEKIWKYYLGMVQALELPLEGRLIKLSSCLSSLVLFTDQSCYTVKVHDGDVQAENLTKIQLDDEDDMIVSLSSGDYHTIALTNKGILYSWGLESQLCGCLGLGSPESVIDDRHIGIWENSRNMRVVKPQKITLDDSYTCVAVCAGGWQAGALIIKK